MWTQEKTIVTTNSVDIASLRDVALSGEGQKYADIVEKLVAEKKLSFRNLSKFANLSSLYKNFREIPIQVKEFDREKMETRTITSNAFSLLAGSLSVAAINEAYEGVEKVSDQLTRTIEDVKEVTRVDNILSSDSSISKVEEGQTAPLIGGSEEYVEIRSNPNARRVEFTEKMFLDNDLGIVVERLSQLGEIAANHEEKLAIRMICDASGSNTSSAAAPYVWNPKGTGTQLYNTVAKARTGASGNRATNNALVDYTDIDACMLLLGAMKDSNGFPINAVTPGLILLVPFALASTAARIVNSELIPGTVNAINPYGPRGNWPLSVVVSPFLDAYSTTAWYLGQFKKQFVKKISRRIEIASVSNTTDSYIAKKIALQVRCDWDVNVGAVDYTYVIQNLSATTYTPSV